MINWRPAAKKVKWSWGEDALAGSEWPRQIGDGILPGHGVMIDLPKSVKQEKAVAVLSQQGLLQVFGA